MIGLATALDSEWVMTPLDCAFANLTLWASAALAPSASRLVFDALQLQDCGRAYAPPPVPSAPAAETRPPELFREPHAGAAAVFVASAGQASGARADGTARGIPM